MSLLQYYPNVSRYVWSYRDRLEIHVDSYMCNQGTKVMYLGFLYKIEPHDYRVLALSK